MTAGANIGLPRIERRNQLASLIGIGGGELAWLANVGRHISVDHYSRSELLKRDGGRRFISSPKRRLRVAQTWIHQWILLSLQPHSAAVAFRPGRSIVENARIHSQMGVIVRVDLADFFHSIPYFRVVDLFCRHGYNEEVAGTLARLTTEWPVRYKYPSRMEPRHSLVDRRLPQGGITSPAIANLVTYGLDENLSNEARRLGYIYTRYADDLTFSHPNSGIDVREMLTTATEVISHERFLVNCTKTRVMRPHQRQVVTGLVINEQSRSGPRVSRADRRRFRAFLHQCRINGWDAMTERLGRDARAYALGYLGYLEMVNPEMAAQFRAHLPPPGSESLD
jgi:hypothetical protein